MAECAAPSRRQQRHTTSGLSNARVRALIHRVGLTLSAMGRPFGLSMAHRIRLGTNLRRMTARCRLRRSNRQLSAKSAMRWRGPNGRTWSAGDAAERQLSLYLRYKRDSRLPARVDPSGDDCCGTANVRFSRKPTFAAGPANDGFVPAPAITGLTARRRETFPIERLGWARSCWTV